MKLGTELKKEEERKEESKKEEKNPKPERTFSSTENVYHFHPIAFVNHMKLILGESGECQCEARIKAFMSMLREGEGTPGKSGYTKAFGGNLIKDLSKHPEKNYGDSTAAGAYQIMRYSWWWLNGHELNESLEKTGVYKENHDYVKKYKIPDYSAESQDKLCLVILKHKRKGILSLIQKGQIRKAIRDYGSLE